MRERNTSRIFTRVAVGLLLAAQVTYGAPSQVNGRLEQIGPFRVLRVWGTPEQMGFAHGYLVGKGYVASAEEYYRNVPLNVQKRDNHLRTMIDAASLSLRDRAELQGLFDGIVAVHGKTPVIKGSGRALTMQDLVFDNAYDFFRAFACSGFTVWGDKAGQAGLLTARNFDFTVPGPGGLGRQMILVRQPAGKNQVATFTWPGFIGAFTGVNEHGVCTFMHDADGKYLRKPQGKYTPVALVLKEFLEEANPANAHAQAKTALKNIVPYPFSYMLRVIAPRVADRAASPVRVFRIDGSGLSENPVAKTSCITTNHYLDRTFSANPNVSKWSQHRYGVLSERTESQVTERAAWEALGAVAVGREDAGTLHSLIVYPERRSLDLAFATWRDGVVPATKSPPTRITFDELFARTE